MQTSMSGNVPRKTAHYKGDSILPDSPTPPAPMNPARTAGHATRRSKSVATWLALVVGSLGLHRLYLHGGRDRWAWLFPGPTIVGAYGFWRLRELGTDDPLGSLLVPLLGISVAAAMLTSIVYGLTPAERWQARHDSSDEAARTGWMTVIGVILALAIGATVTMATIAFSAERYFDRFMPAAVTERARG